jgi:altronate dehydratase
MYPDTMPHTPRPLNDIARLPAAGDNAAIALRTLEAGTPFRANGDDAALRRPVLEGHRFAVRRIAAGQPLLSWGLPFGSATRTIEPGDYLCNPAMLEALAIRDIGFRLPRRSNFTEPDLGFAFEPASFRPGRQVGLLPEPGSFQGHARPGGRGTGTRNFILLLATTSRAASFARALEQRLKSAAEPYPAIDGVVAVTHTEGGGTAEANNRDAVLRALAGFMVHPNVGAVLALDRGGERQGNGALERYMQAHGYPLTHVTHRFHTVSAPLEDALGECEAMVRAWLETVADGERSEQPLACLKLALQCGGSDAFSGVTGNPLAGRVARELLRHGGSAVLAETDELIGAESYILANTRDLETAERFLEKIRRFETLAAWHGQSVRGNPTGGNKFRGLYNVHLKSLGAARKKDPDVRLDHVIEYGERMAGPGYHFMDSPGNDLESIAGQVAAGCNVIMFITGNGSITNFPFVPTIKVVTTTGRYEMLASEMDVNAGRYLDGEAMSSLADETFGYTLRIASGQQSKGERARHSQVSLWRDWRQTDGSRLAELRASPKPRGKPVPVRARDFGGVDFMALEGQRGPAADRVGLIVPSSLCAGQVARLICDGMNEAKRQAGVSRFVALVHTEGCGVSSGDNEEIFLRTMAAYLTHPFVQAALLLEHGCEHTHNDLFRSALPRFGVDPDSIGYASIQMDGGIGPVKDKVGDWFERQLRGARPGERRPADPSAVALGIMAGESLPGRTAVVLAETAAAVVGAGGTVVVPAQCPPITCASFREALALAGAPEPTLAYGERFSLAGLHVMETPGDHDVEALTGLGATGVQLILRHTGGYGVQAHPMIPVLQLADTGHPDADHAIPAGSDDVAATVKALLQRIGDTLSGQYVPRLTSAGYSDFQITRGLLGVSL